MTRSSSATGSRLPPDPHWTTSGAASRPGACPPRRARHGERRSPRVVCVQVVPRPPRRGRPRDGPVQPIDSRDDAGVPPNLRPHVLGAERPGFSRFSPTKPPVARNGDGLACGGARSKTISVASRPLFSRRLVAVVLRSPPTRSSPSPPRRRPRPDRKRQRAAARSCAPVGAIRTRGEDGRARAAGKRGIAHFATGAIVHATRRTNGAAPVFGEPTIAGVAGWGFEADLRLDPSNASRIYMSSPDSGGSDTSWIWRSLDGGKTFKWVPAAAPLNGKVIPCPGGGDTELAVDSAGRLYFNDLSLANFSVSRSDNQGRTFLPCNPAAVPDGGVDRQWYAIDGDPTAGVRST